MCRSYRIPLGTVTPQCISANRHLKCMRYNSKNPPACVLLRRSRMGDFATDLRKTAENFPNTGPNLDTNALRLLSQLRFFRSERWHLCVRNAIRHRPIMSTQTINPIRQLMITTAL